MKHIQAIFHAPVLLAAVAVLPTRVDDPKHKQGEVPLPLPGVSADADDPHVEMRRLFAKIEKDLRQIDRLLADASAGGTTSVGEATKKSAEAAAEIGKLLQDSEERGHAVLAGIDRILELACHERSSSPCESAGGMCQSSSASSGSQSPRSGSTPESGDSQSAGQSPLDRQAGNTTDREATPQAPETSRSDGQRDEPKEGPKDGSKQDAGQPKGDQASSAAARNSPARPPAGSATGDPQSGASPVDRWGELPLHARDVFRAQGGGDMPAQYRDWIDAYYRRMAKRSGS